MTVLQKTVFLAFLQLQLSTRRSRWLVGGGRKVSFVVKKKFCAVLSGLQLDSARRRTDEQLRVLLTCTGAVGLQLRCYYFSFCLLPNF